MKYPALVPDWVCTTPIKLLFEGEGISEDGEPDPIIVIGGDAPSGSESGGDDVSTLGDSTTLYCNWQDGGKTILTAEQKIIAISGTAYFNGDIIPELSNIVAGTAIIGNDDKVREILQGFKRRNPDGTVNYTEIQFK